jgi:hypothetical protein
LDILGAMDSVRPRLTSLPRRALRSILATACACAALLVVAPRAARAAEPSHAFGLGVELGAPSGLAMKYYLGSSSGRGGMVALEAGLGEIYSWGPDGVYLHVDVVWHPAVLVTTPDFTLPFFVGVGGRMLHWRDEYCYDDRGVRYCGGDGDTDLGVRVPFGILMDFHKVPIDIFVELSFVFDLLHIENDDNNGYHYDHDFLSLDGVLGARYYF